MIIGYDTPVCYVETRKCGINSFNRLYAPRYLTENPYTRREVRSTRWKLDDIEGAFSFTFIRHPVSRFRSFWGMLLRSPHMLECSTTAIDAEIVKLGMNETLDIAKCWEDGIEEIYDNNGTEYKDTIENRIWRHLYPYSHPAFLADKIDWIGRLECIGTEWPRLCRLIGEDREKELQHRNRSNVKAVKPWVLPWEIVGRLWVQYAEDHTFGGYTMPSGVIK